MNKSKYSPASVRAIKFSNPRSLALAQRVVTQNLKGGGDMFAAMEVHAVLAVMFSRMVAAEDGTEPDDMIAELIIHAAKLLDAAADPEPGRPAPPPVEGEPNDDPCPHCGEHPCAELLMVPIERMHLTEVSALASAAAAALAGVVWSDHDANDVAMLRGACAVLHQAVKGHADTVAKRVEGAAHCDDCPSRQAPPPRAGRCRADL